MTVLDDFNNLYNEIKHKKVNKITDEFKKECREKYIDLYNLSEKLFDKIFTISGPGEKKIAQKMIEMKLNQDAGIVNKDTADREIGEILCDTYVKPMLNESKKNKKSEN